MSNLPPLRLTGAKILRDGALQARSLVFEQGRITKGPLPAMDMSGYLIMPGLVDMQSLFFAKQLTSANHSTNTRDMLKRTAHAAVAQGVTTSWITQGWHHPTGSNSPIQAEQTLLSLRALQGTLPCDLRVQLRIGTHMAETRDRLLAMIKAHNVAYCVFAQGAADQFHFHDTLTETPRFLCSLAEAFDTLGVTYGSHGDLDGAAREYYRIIGARVAECPQSVGAASVARACNDPVVLSAREFLAPTLPKDTSVPHLINRGLCDALVSGEDYASLPRAVFALANACIRPLARAWTMVSQKPAEIMGLHDRGTLDYGKRADFVVINESTHEIEATVCAGRLVFASGTAGARLSAARPQSSLAAE